MKDTSAYFVGKTIRVLRTEAEPLLTVKSLAARAGCSESHLSQLERGEANATFELLERLAQAIGVGIDKFVGKYVDLRGRPVAPAPNPKEE